MSRLDAGKITWYLDKPGWKIDNEDEKQLRIEQLIHGMTNMLEFLTYMRYLRDQANQLFSNDDIFYNNASLQRIPKDSGFHEYPHFLLNNFRLHYYWNILELHEAGWFDTELRIRQVEAKLNLLDLVYDTEKILAYLEMEKEVYSFHFNPRHYLKHGIPANVINVENRSDSYQPVVGESEHPFRMSGPFPD